MGFSVQLCLQGTPSQVQPGCCLELVWMMEIRLTVPWDTPSHYVIKTHSELDSHSPRKAVRPLPLSSHPTVLDCQAHRLRL